MSAKHFLQCLERGFHQYYCYAVGESTGQEGSVCYNSVMLAVLTLGKFIPLSEIVFLQTVK